MSASTAIISRLQTPVDNNGIRKDIHLITSEKAVIVESPDGQTMTLQERFEELGNGFVESDTKPDRSCLWFKVLSTD